MKINVYGNQTLRKILYRIFLQILICLECSCIGVHASHKLIGDEFEWYDTYHSLWISVYFNYWIKYFFMKTINLKVVIILKDAIPLKFLTATTNFDSKYQF